MIPGSETSFRVDVSLQSVRVAFASLKLLQVEPGTCEELLSVCAAVQQTVSQPEVQSEVF